MPIDPRIALGYQPPAMESPVNMMATMQQLQAAKQANALRQAQMENYASEVARRNALLPSELDKAEREAKAAEIKMGGEQTAAQTAYHKQQRDILATINDPQTYNAWRSSYIAAQPWAEQFLPPPEQFTPDVKQRLLLTADEALKQTVQSQDLGGTTRVLRVPTYSGAATVVPGSEAKKTESPAQRVAERGQDITAQTAANRLELEKAKTGDGSDLPPKERQKREAAFPKASGAYRAATQEIDSLAADIEKLKNHPGLSSITGLVYGRTPSVTAEARQAQAILDRVLAKGQFRGLQAMREASPTGGALGNVSDKEGAALRAAFGSLDRTQETNDFKAALETVLSDLKFSKNNLAQTYDDTYAYREGASPASRGKVGGEQPAGKPPAAQPGTKTTKSGVSYTVEED
jgi:hypothetical protein